MSDMSAPLDSLVEIVTPENIAFHYRVAGPFRRFPAFFIDLLIRWAFLLVLLIAVSAAGVVVGGAAIAVFLVAYFVVEWFYGGLFETFMNGQTPGKWVLGIRVLSLDGQPINGVQAVLRNVLRFVDMMPDGLAADAGGAAAVCPAHLRFRAVDHDAVAPVPANRGPGVRHDRSH